MTFFLLHGAPDSGVTHALRPENDGAGRLALYRGKKKEGKRTLASLSDVCVRRSDCSIGVT